MPVYVYQCWQCGKQFEQRETVRGRDIPRACNFCPDGAAGRVFTPSANIQIPAHFRYTRGWSEPPKGDERWAQMEKDRALFGEKAPDVKSELQGEFKKAGLLR